MAVLAAMPAARVSIATAAKPRFFISRRTANRMSWINLSMARSWQGLVEIRCAAPPLQWAVWPVFCLIRLVCAKPQSYSRSPNPQCIGIYTVPDPRGFVNQSLWRASQFLRDALLYLDVLAALILFSRQTRFLPVEGIFPSLPATVWL